MRIISFGHTTPALVCGAKTVTRRAWKDEYAALFADGDRLTAYNRSPRVGGQPIAVIELAGRPYRESTYEAPASDYDAEGFRFLSAHRLTVFEGATPAALWQDWHVRPRQLWVVRFRLVEGSLTPLGRAIAEQYEGCHAAEAEVPA